MIIRWALGLRSGFKEGSNHLGAGMQGRWLAIALALTLVPQLLLAQVMPGTGVSQSTGSVAASPGTSVSLPGAASAPAGYILSTNDQVAVEVFGEDDLHTSGRLNPEGNLSVPLLGSIHLAGLTLTQAASKLTELYSRDYLVNPKVNIMLLGFAKRRVSVLVQVGPAGGYRNPPVTPNSVELLGTVDLG